MIPLQVLSYDIGPGPGPITSAQSVCIIVIIGGRTSGVGLAVFEYTSGNKRILPTSSDESLDFFKVDTYVYANSNFLEVV